MVFRNDTMKFTISDLQHIDSVSEAPERPGLYVWYGRLSVGAADWSEDLTGGNVAAQKQLLQALRNHSIKYRQQPLQLDALANFSTRWSGGLGSAIPDGWDDDSKGIWSSSGSQHIAKATSSDSARKDLLTLLDDVFPVFNSPLYIGLAIDQSLRSRLLRHRTQFRSHWERASSDPEYPSRIIKPEKFADRAIKMGFSPRDLYFYTLHIDADEEDDENIKDRQKELLRFAEWLLNRWANPLLGRT